MTTVAGWLLPVALTAIAYRTVGSFDFVADCRFLIQQNTFVRSLDYLWDNLTRDYFWSSSGNAIPYWRPLTKLSWLLEYQLFKEDPRGYHLVQLAWHAVGVVGVGVLARLALGLRWQLAALAAALFGLHPLAKEAVCLVMARSDVFAATFVVWSMVCWWQWRTSRQTRWCLAHVAFVALALASKESAVVVAPLVALFGLVHASEESGRPPGGIARSVATVTLPALLLVALYLGARHAVLGGGGLQVTFEPARWLAGLAFYIPGLLPVGLESAVRFVTEAEATSAGVIWRAAGAVVATAALGWLLVRRRHLTSLALIGWIGMALAPVLLVTDIHVPHSEGRFPMAARWGFHAAAPATLLLAWLVGQIEARRARHLVQGLLAGWVIVAAALGPSAHRLFASPLHHLEVEEMAFQSTPARYRTAADRCRARDRQVVRALLHNRPGDAVRFSEAAIVACQPSPTRRFNLLTALVRTGQLGRASPVADALLADLPSDRRNRASTFYLAAATMLHRGRRAAAEQLLREAGRLGFKRCLIHGLLARSAALQARWSTAADLAIGATRACPSAEHFDLALEVMRALQRATASQAEGRQLIATHLQRLEALVGSMNASQRALLAELTRAARVP